MASIPSWKDNVSRSGGFWGDGNWYDLHLERRMPLAIPMLEEMLAALPPLPPGTAVCDLACGTGNASATVLSAYPDVHVVLLDDDPEMLSIARSKVEAMTIDVEPLQASVSTDGDPVPGGPYDVVLAALALHAIVGHEVDRAEAETRYELVFRGIRDALAPGGHVIVGDHVGTLPLYTQLKTMERAGFQDVDCAWRQDDFFVAGGRIAA
jgi:trans-aconitate methyltransferase